MLDEMVGPASVDGHLTAHVYFIAEGPGMRVKYRGRSRQGSMCGNNDGKPRVMVGYNESDMKTCS